MNTNEHAKTCEHCEQPLPEPKTVWLTRREVQDAFHFDPEPYEDLKSKLQPAKLTDGTAVLVRMYLKPSVEAKAAEIRR